VLFRSVVALVGGAAALKSLQTELRATAPLSVDGGPLMTAEVEVDAGAPAADEPDANAIAAAEEFAADAGTFARLDAPGTGSGTPSVTTPLAKPARKPLVKPGKRVPVEFNGAEAPADLTVPIRVGGKGKRVVR
jgi:hypothetical protein